MSKYKPRYTGDRSIDSVIKDVYDILNQLTVGVNTISRTNVASTSGGQVENSTFSVITAFDYTDFNTTNNILYTVPANYILEKVIVIVDTAFDLGTLKIKDTVTLVEEYETDLTVQDSYTINKYKKYSATTPIKADYIGIPTVGSGYIILKVTKI